MPRDESAPGPGGRWADEAGGAEGAVVEGGLFSAMTRMKMDE
jgi:hypothetical protein